MNAIANRVSLITGGSRGLGRSTALALARSGSGIIVTYRTQADSAAEVVREVERLGGKAVALRLDMAEAATFPGFVEEVRLVLRAAWSRDSLDILVNNAGMGMTAPIAQTEETVFDQLMAVHLKGVFFLTQSLLPLIADGGRIVNLSSGLTRFSLPGYAAYAMMKGGVEVFTRYLAKELGPRGIAVNTVAPGAIETDFGGGVVRDNAGVNGMIASQTALGRVGLPEDIGPAIAALLSPASGWVNAQRIEVSGGMFV